MAASSEKSHWWRELWRRTGEVILAIGMGVSIFYFWQFIQVERVNLQQKRQVQENSPSQEVAQQQLKDALQKHEHDIQRIQNLLLPKEAIGDFVSILEREATASQIQLEVPQIAEDEKFDENHQPIPQTGPYVDVRLKIVGIGRPIQLLQFLHRIENLPYIVRVVEWEVQGLRPEEVPSFSLVAPATGVTGAVLPTTTPIPQGQVSAILILTMKQGATHE